MKGLRAGASGNEGNLVAGVTIMMSYVEGGVELFGDFLYDGGVGIHDGGVGDLDGEVLDGLEAVDGGRGKGLKQNDMYRRDWRVDGDEGTIARRDDPLTLVYTLFA